MSTYLYVGPRAPQSIPNDEKFSFSVYSWDESTGKLTLSGHVPGYINAGNVQTDLDRMLLYISDEVSANPTLGMGGGGRIFTFSIDRETGMLTKVEDVLSFGGHPSYLALDSEKKYMITTHFLPLPPVPSIRKNADGKYEIKPMHGDNGTILRHINPDGTLGEVCDVVYHLPEGDHPQRPPHMHCAVPSPDGAVFAACDMGLDKIYLFRINKESNSLEIVGGKPFQYKRGYGTRYCAFHPNKPWLFVNCEHAPVMIAFRWDTDGTMEEICCTPSFEDGYDTRNVFASDMALSTDGKFIYNCMRGSNTVSVYAVDQETGILSLIQVYKMQGVKPRSCVLSPEGKYLVVSNTDSNLVEVIAVGEDGKLSSTENSISEGWPGTLTFVTL